jgi:hypothetical protein
MITGHGGYCIITLQLFVHYLIRFLIKLHLAHDRLPDEAIFLHSVVMLATGVSHLTSP